MNEFLIFCKSHWNLILICFLTIVQLVLFFFKKKPIKVIDSVGTILYKNIPIFIKAAESYFGAGNGEKKLEYVIACVTKLFESMNIDFNLTYKRLTEDIIEEFLSTPQKK